MKEPQARVHLYEEDLDLLIEGLKMVKGTSTGYCETTVEHCMELIDKLTEHMEKLEQKGDTSKDDRTVEEH